jgi:PKD repeat protein
MNKKRKNTIFIYLLISILLLASFQSYNSNPLPPKTLYGTSSRTDGESTFGASIVASASGLPNEYGSVDHSAGGWHLDIGPDTGVEWPDGTFFTVTITMTGWIGMTTGVVSGIYNDVGNVILYPESGPLFVNAGGIYYGDANEEVEFYGSASGGITPYSWFWDFGDGDNSNAQNPAKMFSEPGTYIVTLTVTDYIGQTATDYTNAIIYGDSSLVTEANGPYEGYVEEEIQFNGDVTGGIPPYTWFWDFGDGESSDEQNPSHVFLEFGDYEVVLTVTDKNLNTDSDETVCTVNIDNEPPIKPLISGLPEGKSGEEYEYNFVTLDPEDDDVYYFIDWGDDNNEGWLGPYESGQSIDVAHSWDEQGYYTLRAKAKDIHDFESDWSEFEVEMPKSKSNTYHNNISIEFRGGLGLKIIVTNTGDIDIQGLELTITMDAPWMFLGGGTSTTIDIASGVEETITTGFFLGFGPFEVTVELLDITEKRSGFLLGPFVILY